MAEYQGGTASWWSFSSSKKSILSTLLCLDRYFVCAIALQVDSTCAIDSCAFPHILHLTSDFSLDSVFLALNSFVGSSCSWSSLIPAIVCFSAVFLSLTVHPLETLTIKIFIPACCLELSLPSLFSYAFTLLVL